MTSYGFIITRHVNIEKTNKYWNQCIKLIRRFYPDNKIVVIDDNSKQELIIPDCEYSNVTYIQSEYPGRGELLPYIYYLKFKWFPSAIIIHDSLFIHYKMRFELFNIPILPLWHHKFDNENIHNVLRIASILTNNESVIKKLRSEPILGFHHNKINLCFGCQAYIKLHFLEHIEKKYKISELVKVVHNRTDRCALERVFGAIFCIEYPKLTIMNSLFGDILTKYRNNLYNYDEYMRDLNNNQLRYLFVKVWTGR